jgi:membrane protease YdiL (CAAX protease family)
VILLRVIAVLVGLIAIVHGGQAFVGAKPGHDPQPLVVEHLIVLVFGLIAAYGLWRGQRWAPLMLALYGLAIAVLIVSLGPLLALEGAARNGLWTGAATMLLLTALAVWYAERHVTRLSSRGA